MAIRVVVADDQAVMLEALVQLLAVAPDIEVVGTARDAVAALSVCEETAPDVALLDVRMPYGGGAAVASSIRALGLDTRIVAISAFDDDTTRDHMTAAGATAYVLKDGPILDVLAAIRRAAQRATTGSVGSTP